MEIKKMKNKTIPASLLLLASLSGSLYILSPAALLTGLLARRRLQELRKRKFYIFLAFFALIPALLLPGQLSPAVAFKIFLRTIVVFGSFTLISENINFSKIRKCLTPVLGADSAKALTVAMNIYPSMRRDLYTGWALMNLNSRKRFIILRFPGMAVNCALKVAEEIALRMKAEAPGPEVFIITGDINSGKSFLMAKLAEEQKKLGKKTGGIIAEGVFSDGVKTGFDIFEPGSGKKYSLAKTEESRGDISAGKYRFSLESFEKAKEALMDFDENSVVFLDEAGPLELDGEGYALCLESIMASNIESLYLTVRESCVGQIREKFLGRASKINFIRP